MLKVPWGTLLSLSLSTDQSEMILYEMLCSVSPIFSGFNLCDHPVVSSGASSVHTVNPNSDALVPFLVLWWCAITFVQYLLITHIWTVTSSSSGFSSVSRWLQLPRMIWWWWWWRWRVLICRFISGLSWHQSCRFLSQPHAVRSTHRNKIEE